MLNLGQKFPSFFFNFQSEYFEAQNYLFENFPPRSKVPQIKEVSGPNKTGFEHMQHFNWHYVCTVSTP